MPILLALVGGFTGLTTLGGLGGLMRYFRSSELPVDPRALTWHKAAFYEPDGPRELEEDIWRRMAQLEARWPGELASRYRAIATDEQDIALMEGWVPDSVAIEIEHPQQLERANDIMRLGAETIATQDGLTRTEEKGTNFLSVRKSDKRAARRAATHFLRYWIAAVKLQFEMRQDRPSDRAAMRTWLGKELRARGVRVTHIARAAPLVVRLALLPDAGDEIAVLSAETARSRTRWGRLCYNFTTWLQGVTTASGRPEGW